MSFPTLTVATITGSTHLSGSTIYGKDANITNVTATNVTGSTLVSGSSIYGASGTITNVYVTNLTGSGNVSGSLVRGSVISGSQRLGVLGSITSTGNISGSTFSGSITQNMDGNARVAVRKNSGGTGYKRRRLNLIEGSNVTLTVADDSGNEEVDVTVAASYASGSAARGDYSYMVYSGSGIFTAENWLGGVVYGGSGNAGGVSGSNARDVIEKTWEATSLISGSLFIKAGEYPVPICITGSSNTLVYGEGMGTHIYLADNQPTTAGLSHRLWQVISFSGAENVTLRDLNIDGNYMGQNLNWQERWDIGQAACLDISECSNITVDHCIVKNHYKFGIDVQIYGGGVSKGIRIINNYVENVFWNPIEVMIWNGYARNITIANNIIKGFCDIAIGFPAHPSHDYWSEAVTVTGNMIYGGLTNDSGSSAEGSPDAIAGIRPEDMRNSTISNNNITGTRSAIYPSYSCHNLSICNNIAISDIDGGNGTITLSGQGHIVSNNIVPTGYFSGDTGIRVVGRDMVISNNKIFNVSGSSNCYGIIESNWGGDYIPYNNTIKDNRISGSFVKAISFSGLSNQLCRDNRGYNPLGVIANPVTSTSIVDSGTDSIVSATTYTNIQSPKTIYIRGGTVSDVKIGGTTVYVATNCSVYLEPLETFSVTWSSAPTIVVIGS